MKDFGDTRYFQDNTGEVYPQLEQACFAQTGEAFDSDGRPNLIGKNLIIREAVHMTKGPYGPYFNLHVIVDGMGEFSVLTRGEVVAEAIEAVSGIELGSGRKVGEGELPVAMRVLFAEGDGDYGGYYYPVGWAQTDQEEQTEEVAD